MRHQLIVYPIIILGFVFFVGAKSQGQAILIEDAGRPVSNESVRKEIRGALTSSSQSVYLSAQKMREDRLAGAGVSIGGTTGFLGAHIELNFDQENSVIAAFGNGSGYNTFALSWKNSFEGGYVNPYFRGGYARWYNSTGMPNGGKDSSVLKDFLSQREMESGRFGVDIASVAAGIQYNELSGEFTGLTVFAEAILMVDLQKQHLVPNGSVGTTYFF